MLVKTATDQQTNGKQYRWYLFIDPSLPFVAIFRGVWPAIRKEKNFLPSTLERFLSMLATHEAHVIPPTFNMTFSRSSASASGSAGLRNLREPLDDGFGGEFGKWDD